MEIPRTFAVGLPAHRNMDRLLVLFYLSRLIPSDEVPIPREDAGVVWLGKERDSDASRECPGGNGCENRPSDADGTAGAGKRDSADLN